MRRLPALMLAAGAMLAAPAFADTDYVPIERVTTTVWDPASASWVERTTTYYAQPSEPALIVHDPAPVVAYTEPIIVTAPRSEDGQVTHDVIHRIAADPSMDGRIGVETFRNEVTLTGRVGTRNQIDRAGYLAATVDGVREVHNLLRSQSGNS